MHAANQRRPSARPKPPCAHRASACVRAVAAGLLLLTAGGCAEEHTFKFEDLNLLPIHEELTEFPLGKYMVPIPVLERSGDQPQRLNRLQFDFRLFALISPPEKPQIESAWSQHEGKIRDQVMRVCRTAAIEDLLEPDLATLKVRLIEALRPQIGDRLLREILITEVTSQEI